MAGVLAEAVAAGFADDPAGCPAALDDAADALPTTDLAGALTARVNGASTCSGPVDIRCVVAMIVSVVTRAVIGRFATTWRTGRIASTVVATVALTDCTAAMGVGSATVARCWTGAVILAIASLADDVTVALPGTGAAEACAPPTRLAMNQNPAMSPASTSMRRAWNASELASAGSQSELLPSGRTLTPTLDTERSLLAFPGRRTAPHVRFNDQHTEEIRGACESQDGQAKVVTPAHRLARQPRAPDGPPMEDLIASIGATRKMPSA